MKTVEILNALEDCFTKRLTPFRIYETKVHPVTGQEKLSIFCDGLMPSMIKVLVDSGRDYMLIPNTVEVYNPELDNDEVIACLELIVY